MEGERRTRTRIGASHAFTLIELLVVVAIIAVLAALLLPVLSRGKSGARRIECASHLAQLRIAIELYTSENVGLLPVRSSTNRWPAQLVRHYSNLRLLRCPQDPAANEAASASTNSNPDLSLRSYLMNGFQDYFTFAGKSQPPTAMRQTAIRQAIDTILVGEKKSGSGQFYVVLDSSAAYLSDLEESRHGGHEGSLNKSGYSNYAFADGHVAILRYGKSTCPFNLWAVTEAGRIKYAVCRPAE